MPTYLFLNTETNEPFEDFLSYEARKILLDENPHIIPIVTAPAIVSGVSSGMKTDGGFNEVLSKIGEAHPASALADKHVRRSNKQVKTREIVKKHFGKK